MPPLYICLKSIYGCAKNSNLAHPLFYLIVIYLLFYFLLPRPQRLVIQNNFGLMIDGVIDNSPVMKETELYKMNGIRFQPVLLNSENNENPNFRGMGLFSRGLHLPWIS